MVLAGILAAALPETAGVATPETLNQAPQRSAAEDARLVRLCCHDVQQLCVQCWCLFVGVAWASRSLD